MEETLILVYGIILSVSVVCAAAAVSAKRLLTSALWLAGASAMVSILLYLLGAPEIAVIELSVGAGLVTVLFVFAINIAGEEALETRSIVPRPVAWILIAGSLLLLGGLNLPKLDLALPVPGLSNFAETLWEQRGLDLMVQIALIFSGVLGVLGLLSEPSWADEGQKEAHS